MKRGDVGVNYTATILGQNGQVLNTSGLNPVLFVWPTSSGGSLVPIISGRALTNTNPSAGVVTYTIASGDTTALFAVNTYNAEIQLSSSGFQQSTTTFGFQVFDSPL